MKKIISLSLLGLAAKAQLSETGVVHANKCETCKFMSIEMQNSLMDTGKNKEKIDIGRFTVTAGKEKKIDYQRSEVRFIETTEAVCERLLEYNMHKERSGSNRFAKGQSQTFEALEGLVGRGVKVDIGIPHDMWKEPSAEVTQMKKQCERYMEDYLDDIEEWYMDKDNFGKSLQDYLCKDLILKGQDDSCLEESWTGKELVDEPTDDEKSVKEEL